MFLNCSETFDLIEQLANIGMKKYGSNIFLSLIISNVTTNAPRLYIEQSKCIFLYFSPIGLVGSLEKINCENID